MSLQVWLPMTNTFENHGLLGPLTQTSAPAYVNGKLGKALSTGGCKMSASQTASVLNNKAISICFWVYINADTGSTNNRTMFFGSDAMGENNNRKFSLFNYPTVNDFHWSWMNDAANTIFASNALSGVLPSYQWTHVAVTYENPNGTVYINGAQKHVFIAVSDSSSFVYETQVIYNSSYMYRNDFRIYDHCLSPKEVKEISKGLFLHYKLGGIDGYFCGRNLLKNSNFSQNMNYWVVENGTGSIQTNTIYEHSLLYRTNSRIYNKVSNVWKKDNTYTVSYLAKKKDSIISINDYIKKGSENVGNGTGITVKEVDENNITLECVNSSAYNFLSIDLTKILITGVTYKITCNSSGSNIGLYFDEATDSGFSNRTLINVDTLTVVSGRYYRFKIYGNISGTNQTTTYTNTYSNVCLRPTNDVVELQPSRSLVDYGSKSTLSYNWKKYTTTITCTDTVPAGTLSISTSNNAALIYVTDVKLELGNTPSLWTPAPEDNPTLYNTTTEFDTSGFSNNGTIVNSIDTDGASPRYDCSYTFNGSNQYISLKNSLTKGTDTFSISFWMNTKSDDTQTLYTARTAVGNGIALFLYNNCFRLDDNTQTIFDDYSISSLKNQWIHACVVRDKTSKKLYVNGNLVSTKNAVGDMENIGTHGTIGGSEASDNGVATGNWFNGSISDFRMYATALSASDVKELYNTPISITNTGVLMTQGEFKEV